MEHYRLRNRGYASSISLAPPWEQARGMDYYRKMCINPDPVYDHYPEDNKYLEKMQDILSAYPCFGVPRDPSEILGNVWLGTNVNAENLSTLRKHKIRYVLNCAGGHPVEFRRMRELYQPEEGIMGYEELCVEDKETFNIRDYFERAHAFIDYARARNSRVLLCCPGVSRSGAVAISYLVANGHTLLQAVRDVKDSRRVALCNNGFMKQLVRYARDRGMLDWDIDSVGGDRMGKRFYRYRINATTIPRTTPLSMSKKRNW